jgi:UDP-glucose 4-epimerase
VTTLVTGGTGFVGGNLVKALAARGHRVVALDLAPPEALVAAHLAPWRDRVVFAQADVLTPEELERAAPADVTQIVHAAVSTGFERDVEAATGRTIVEINVLGTTNVLELARNRPVERFLYVSSASVYGAARGGTEPLTEASALEPRTLYELTKHASELIVRRYADLHGLNTISARLSGPYGPLERVTVHRTVQSFVKEWTAHIVRGEPVEVRNRSERHKLIHVSDVADALVALLQAPRLSHDVYNVCGLRTHTLGDVAETLLRLRPGIRVVDVGGDGLEDSTLFRVDPTRIQRELGFKPRFDLESGLADYLAWRERHAFRD